MPGRIHVGTSGWVYKHWRGPFYPHDLPQTPWLDHYAQRFRTVEINNTFYRMPGGCALHLQADDRAFPPHESLGMARHMLYLRP